MNNAVGAGVRSVFLRVCAAAVAAVMLLIAGVGPGGGTEYDLRQPEACRLHFTVLSDVHIETNNLPCYQIFVKSLQDVKRNRSGNDAVLFLGDSTMNGQPPENLIFHGTVARMLRGETVLPVMGNHDCGNGEGDFDKIQNRWFQFTAAFFGRRLEHPYYYEVINGFYCIVLGMEAQAVYEMQMSETQLAWLADVLAQAAASGKPAFVFSHFPTSCMTDETGAHSGRLAAMLAEYNRTHDLICFVGHYHTPLSMSSFRTNSGFPEIFVPRLTELGGDDGHQPVPETGVGLVVEVYENEIAVRGRDFYRSTWKYDTARDVPCEVTYPLKTPIVSE